MNAKVAMVKNGISNLFLCNGWMRAFLCAGTPTDFSCGRKFSQFLCYCRPSVLLITLLCDMY